MALIFARTALHDLRGIRDFIAVENAEAAERVARRLVEACRTVERHPAMGRTAERPGTREFVVRPYVIAYRPQGGDVVILRVRHGAQER